IPAPQCAWVGGRRSLSRAVASTNPLHPIRVRLDGPSTSAIARISMDATPQLSAERLDELYRARIAVSIAFFIIGAGLGLWAVHIPIVSARLNLDSAVLGFVLLVMAIG